MDNQKLKKPFCIKSRIDSLKYALNGIKLLIIGEHNARIHVAIAICVLLLSIFLKISTLEWIIVLMLIGLVLISESFNTAIEYLSDFIEPEYHEIIKRVKDLSAGAVLITSLTSLIVGIIIFLPKIYAFF